MFKFLTVFATLVAISVSSPVGATGLVNPETNHADYWGSNCVKTDFSGEVKTYSVTQSGVTKVIVKGGTGYIVYDKAPYTNLTAPLNPKNNQTYAISHVIVCGGTTTTNTGGSGSHEDGNKDCDKDHDGQKPPVDNHKPPTTPPKTESGGVVLSETKPATTTAPATLPETGSNSVGLAVTAGLLSTIGGYLYSVKRKQSA